MGEIGAQTQLGVLRVVFLKCFYTLPPRGHETSTVIKILSSNLLTITILSLQGYGHACGLDAAIRSRGMLFVATGHACDFVITFYDQLSWHQGVKIFHSGDLAFTSFINSSVSKIAKYRTLPSVKLQTGGKHWTACKKDDASKPTQVSIVLATGCDTNASVATSIRNKGERICRCDLKTLTKAF
ncbi:unnamed protein product [Timema podura]|uniref:Uncharacterized protein n=1 Tax=Timema podura TaxID=61482 RepID=A0ABN7NUM3_TIMPD|nr:unnamed protein product [Timema podura]